MCVFQHHLTKLAHCLCLKGLPGSDTITLFIPDLLSSQATLSTDLQPAYLCLSWGFAHLVAVCVQLHSCV